MESRVDSNPINKLPSDKPSMMEIFEKFINKKEKLNKIINQIAIVFWEFVIIPMMIIIIITLGSVQTMYPHESTFQEDLNSSLGFLGSSIYRVYEIGAENTNWIYYSILIFVILIYYAGKEAYHKIKCICMNVNSEMDAQSMIDSCNTKTEMNSRLKGGNKYKNDSINNR